MAAMQGLVVALGSMLGPCLGTWLPTAFCVSVSPPRDMEQFFAWILLLF